MDKIPYKTSFKQWLSPISDNLFDKLVKHYQLDVYTKKLYTASFMKLLLFAQPHETESLRALSDCVFLEELQQATQLDSISFSQLGQAVYSGV